MEAYLRYWKPVTFLLLIIGHCSLAAKAQDLDALFQRVESSVVIVRTTDTESQGTGFVWDNPSTVVTALHVVDGSSHISVRSPSLGKLYRARVSRVFTEADLVLLEVIDAPPMDPLSHDASLPPAGTDVYALGVRKDAQTISSYSFQPRWGERTLRRNIPRTVARKLETNGYPSPDLEVLHLGGEGLLPGLSGAPIFTADGSVVAVGNGGLEKGATNITWGIPSSNLLRLRSSQTIRLPNSKGTRELFSADLRAEVGPVISDGEVELQKMRTRTFSELVETADDQRGLAQLAAGFSIFNPSTFEYDIYRDLGTGATIVIPAGARLVSNQNAWHVDWSGRDVGIGSRFEMWLKIDIGSSLVEADQLSMVFERWISLKFPGVSWTVDQNWSYVQPLTRFDGLVVRRKAYIGQKNDGFQWIPQVYAFETLASRSGVFVGLVAFDNNYTPARLDLEARCANGVPNPLCDALYKATQAWAQMVLGVHLTTFPL